MNNTEQAQVIELIQSGRADLALQMLTRHLEYEPRDWYAHYMSGVACRFLDRLEHAMAHLSEAIAIQPDQAPVHLALGIAQQLAGRLDQAALSLSQAIELQPDLYEAYNSLGITYKKQGRYKEALDAYARGTDRLMHSVSAAVHADPSRCYRDEEVDGKRTRTVLPYVFIRTRELIRATPLYAILRNNMAVCLEELGAVSEARELYQEAIELTPDGYAYPDPHENLRRLNRDAN